MRRPRISPIIPAFHKEKHLGRTPGSVNGARERYGEPWAVEVLVVDNCPTDDTAGVARSHGARVLREKRRCIASVRNRGTEEAKGEIVAFLDADATVTPGIFNSIHAAMSSGKYIGGGTLIKLERNSPGLFCTYRITVVPARWLPGIAGGVLFTARETFRVLGGFDDSLHCAEDVEFAYRLKRYGREWGEKFKNLTEDHVVTSTRAFDAFGERYYFRNLQALLKHGGTLACRDRGFCRHF